MNKKTTWIVAIITTILVIAIAGITYLFLRSEKEKKELVQNFELDKKDLENEYTGFAKQYDELKFITSNDSLSTLLSEEQVKVQRLLEQLRSVKATNASEIRRLKNELNLLRKVMVGYVNQIDSLNRLNKSLTAENQEVKQKYLSATEQISNLSEEKKNLHNKVTLAAQLDATGITLLAKDKKGKQAKKVKDIVKFQIGFTIVKNITAEAGNKTIYIRITKPDNDVLTKNGGTFSYENRNLTYSIKKYVEYTGEEQSVTVFWDVEEFLYAGSYGVDIFADGNLIGSKRFTIE
ncbi:hypothetical protein SAMN05444405_11715 [Bacteroides luti]|jgi:DnaJ-domain-containing protein 1|uniref:Cell division protein ZapB n=1 Tax=Bacteroides luti TaxID=1297750 RepID=A0A1M5FKB7_9BACE|nr:hypothetical protein [Bacteroides luti]SHF91948.1 hypothetical protein SAMN05444405_11715 [Bacteroides luti]